MTEKEVWGEVVKKQDGEYYLHDPIDDKDYHICHTNCDKYMDDSDVGKLATTTKASSKYVLTDDLDIRSNNK